MLVKITRAILISLLFNCLLISQTLYVPSGVNGIGTSTTNNVGIGVSNPGYPLVVNGKILTLNSSGNAGDVNTGSNGIYSFRDGDYARYVRFNTIGTYNDLLSAGAKLVINFGHWVDPQPVTFFEWTKEGFNPTVDIYGYDAGAGDAKYGRFYVNADGKFTMMAQSGEDFSIVTGNNERFTILNNGNVGIGTTTPNTNCKLDLVGNLGVSGKIVNPERSDITNVLMKINPSSEADDTNGDLILSGYYPIIFKTDFQQERMRINRNGTIGIGSTRIDRKLTVESENDMVLFLGNNTGYGVNIDFIDQSWQARIRHESGTLLFCTGGCLNEKMRIDAYGRVGIGTTSPAFPLDVVGTIRTNGLIKADEIQVTENGADFVFEPDYDLPTLEEVETHIKEHKHLPDIPSAKEVEANGVNVGEMQMKHLQKIEELTLYIIEQNKKLVEQNNKILELEERLAKVEGRK